MPATRPEEKDHFGKGRSIRDTASNRFFAFGYDGKGNQKEVSKPGGASGNREDEYYGKPQ